MPASQIDEMVKQLTTLPQQKSMSPDLLMRPGQNGPTGLQSPLGGIAQPNVMQMVNALSQQNPYGGALPDPTAPTPPDGDPNAPKDTSSAGAFNPSPLAAFS